MVATSACPLCDKASEICEVPARRSDNGDHSSPTLRGLRSMGVSKALAAAATAPRSAVRAPMRRISAFGCHEMAKLAAYYKKRQVSFGAAGAGRAKRLGVCLCILHM
jgi:cytochrome c553